MPGILRSIRLERIEENLTSNETSNNDSSGGLGSSQILSVGKLHKGIRSVTNARAIIGAPYLG